MNICELISQLEDLKEQYGEEIDVRIAEQPRWPFENEISQVEVANLASETCDVCDGSEVEVDEDDREVPCSNCDGTGVHRKDGKTEDEWVVYIGEGQQLGYLPTAACNVLGWRDR